MQQPRATMHNVRHTLRACHYLPIGTLTSSAFNPPGLSNSLVSGYCGDHIRSQTTLLRHCPYLVSLLEGAQCIACLASTCVDLEDSSFLANKQRRSLFCLVFLCSLEVLNTFYSSRKWYKVKKLNQN